ncbi:MAG TPA: hypothetical protein DDW34_06160 [Clostridium sp.]|nr:hypothetical protein [Clostridium sp.]
MKKNWLWEISKTFRTSEKEYNYSIDSEKMKWRQFDEKQVGVIFMSLKNGEGRKNFWYRKSNMNDVLEVFLWTFS